MEAWPTVELGKLAPGESVFVPALRVWGVLSDGVQQAAQLEIPVSYRVTVVDGKYGVLFTRMQGGAAGLRNEDSRDKGY
jgi:hypothetical protein